MIVDNCQNIPQNVAIYSKHRHSLTPMVEFHSPVRSLRKHGLVQLVRLAAAAVLTREKRETWSTEESSGGSAVDQTWQMTGGWYPSMGIHGYPQAAV